MKKISQCILYLTIFVALAVTAVALSKPISGFVLQSDGVTAAENATVIVYVNTSISAFNPCRTVPNVSSGADGSYATNLGNLKRNDGTSDCSGLWATGDLIWAEGDGTFVTPVHGLGTTNTSATVEAGTGLQTLENMTLAAGPDSTAPNITLISPDDNNISTTGNVVFIYNVSDASNVDNCSLIFNGTINETDTSITKDVDQNFTVSNLPNGLINWSVNCTDASGNIGTSEFRILNVSKVGRLNATLITPSTNVNVTKDLFFEFSVVVTCLDGDCGDINASLDPKSFEPVVEEEEEKTFWEVLKEFFSGNLITGLASGSLVPTTPTTPFWTNTSNPANLSIFPCLGNLQEGSECNVTWYVNASGDKGTTAEFFAFFNSTTFPTLFNETNRINITITPNVAPIVQDVILNSTLLTNFTNENLTLFFNATDVDNDSVKNITDWRLNGASIAVLNMPFEAGSLDGNVTGVPNGTKDYSIFGNNGTVTNATFNATGGYDGYGAYEFDPSGGNSISLGEPDSLKITDQITVSAWIKTNSTNVTVLGTDRAQTIVAKDDTTNRAYSLYIPSSGNISFYIFESNSIKRVFGPNPTDNNWHLATGTFDGQTVRVYLDGIISSDTDSAASIDNDPANVLIGARSDNEIFFNGTIDEVRIYNRSLTEEQILALYQNRTDLIVPQETRGEQTWQAAVTPNDGIEDGVTVLSNSLTIESIATTDVILNTTSLTNFTNENLTLNYSLVNGSEKAIIDWRQDTQSIAVLNMPFEGNDNASFTRDYTQFRNNGTVINATFNATGGFDGQGTYEFDGDGDIITISDSNELDFSSSDSFSVSALIKTNYIEDLQFFINKVGSGNDPGYVIQTVANGSIAFAIADGTTSSSVISSTNVTNGVYHHIVGVRDANTKKLKIYVNGILEATNSDTTSANLANGLNLIIGSRNPSVADREFVNGTIDEVRIYNRSLTPEQILALYQNRTDLIVSQETRGGQTWQAAITPHTFKEDGTEVVSNEVNIQFIEVANVTLNTTSINNFTTDNLTVNYTLINGSEKAIIDWRQDTQSIAVLNMPFEGNDNASFTKDYSQFGNDGTVFNATFNATGGFDGQGAYEFDGDDFINISDQPSLNPTTAITVAAWVNIEDKSPVQYFISKPFTAGAEPFQQYSIQSLPSGEFSFTLSIGGTRFEPKGTTNGTENTWYHVVGTYDGSNARLYVDGILENETSVVGSLDVYATDLYVGLYQPGSNYFNGTIDELQIYNRSLSSDQILALYQNRTDLIVSQETRGGQTWQATVTPHTFKEDGVEVVSNEVNIQFIEVANVTLNTTSINNFTTDNLTVNYTLINGSEKAIVDWRVNGTSIAVLNMPLEGNENTSFTRDYSQFGNNGTVINATFNATGGFDGQGAYEFDGATSGIKIEKKVVIPSGAFSIEAWFNTQSNDLFQTIFSQSQDNTSALWRLRIDSGGILNFFSRDIFENVTGELSSNSSVGANVWNHVVFTHDPMTGMRIYLNGTLNANTTDPINGTEFHINRSTIGYLDRNSTEAVFNGTIDEVRIYNRSLSAEQILALYQNRTDLVHSNETTVGDTWQSCVTPHTFKEDGTEVCSNNLTINAPQDNQSPTVEAIIPTQGTSFNFSQVIEIAANVTDNVAVDNVSINITFPNGTVQQLFLSNDVGNKYNISFTIPNLIGAYNISFFANDTSNNINSSESTFFAAVDIIPPNVTGLIPTAGSSFNITSTIEIAANVTDNLAVSAVLANVTFPNGTTELITLTNVLGDKYNGTFTIPLLLGQYNITILANDTNNTVNNTETTFFNGADIDEPFVNLISPADTATLTSQNVSISCNATNFNLTNVTLYINSSGTFEANQTVNVTGSFAEANFNVTLSNAAYTWNCLAADTSGNSAFAANNRTFTVASAFNITIYIDGNISTEFNQTALPYLVTVNIQQDNSDSVGTEVVIFEEQGNNIFIPLRQDGIVSRAETRGSTDSGGNITFVIAPTHYPAITDYKIGVGVISNSEIVASQNLTIANNGSIVFTDKTLSPTALNDNAKVTVNSMNAIINSLFIWANTLEQAIVRNITFYDNGTILGNLTVQTGAPNVLNISIRNSSNDPVNGFIRAQESDGYLMFNPATDPSSIGSKNHSHFYQFVNDSIQFVITPTEYSLVDSEVNISVYHNNLTLIDTFNLSINPNLEPRNGTSYVNDELKVIVNSMNSVISSLFVALN